MGMLLQFQARRELLTEDLARRFEVSVRTVYRDVQALSAGGVPIASLPGKGYRLLDGYFLPPVTFTADEAAVLALGGRFVRDRVDAGLRRRWGGWRSPEPPCRPRRYRRARASRGKARER